MDELSFYRERAKEREESEAALTGELIFESISTLGTNKKILKKFVHQAISLRLREIRGEATWASYLVIFSPGQEAEETRCQIDLETDGGRGGFAVGYGSQPSLAFVDAVERMQWSEKSEQVRMII